MKGKKCKSNFGGDESTDKEVFEPMASRNENESSYKCSHCFLIYTAVEPLMKHLLTHQRSQLKLPKASGFLETEERKTNKKSLSTCKVTLTRCDDLYSPFQPTGTVHTRATKIQKGVAIAGSTLPRKRGSEPEKPNNLIKNACSRRFLLQQSSDCDTTNEVGAVDILKPHKCQLCSKSFGTRQRLEIHTRTHTGERPYQCQFCPKSFAQQGHLKSHIRTHTGERPHRCQLCLKSFGSLENLKNHIRTHTGEQPHRCQLCSKSFAQQGNLKSHIRTHTCERPHQCQLCSQSFGSLGGLKYHIRTHTGERPHRCQLCLKSFGSLGGLKYHIRTHTGERPHQCQLCSKSFGSLGTLKNHIRTHTGERPHQCQLCSKSFAQQGNLKSHIQTQHIEKL